MQRCSRRKGLPLRLSAGQSNSSACSTRKNARAQPGSPFSWPSVGFRDKLYRMNRERLLNTAARLIEVPSPTGAAGAAADRLAEILSSDGFPVERVAAGHATAPAVVARLDSGKPS